MIPLSSGAKKDILIMFFARSLLEVALDLQKDEEGTIQRDNKKYHLNKRIDRRIKTLIGKIDTTMQQLPKESLEPLRVWMKRKQETKLKTLIESLSFRLVQFELLALYILQANFEVRPHLLNIFEWLTEASNYFDKVDMILECGVSEAEDAEMYKLALDSITYIKG